MKLGGCETGVRLRTAGTLLISALYFLSAGAASAATDSINHQQGWDETATIIIKETWIASSSYLASFLAQSPIDITKQLSALVAISSIAYNLRALNRAWHAIISAKPLLNFRGRRIGSSKKYQEPMRALLLSFTFYTAYQFLSHVTDLASPTTSPQMIMLDGLIQVALLVLVLWQFRTIRVFATDAFGQDDTKQGRFWTLINEALDEHKINLRNLFRSAIVLPLTFAAPRLAEAYHGGWSLETFTTTVADTAHELDAALSAMAL